MVLPGTAFPIMQDPAQALLLPAMQDTAGLKETHLAQLIPERVGDMELRFCL